LVIFLCDWAYFGFGSDYRQVIFMPTLAHYALRNIDARL